MALCGHCQSLVRSTVSKAEFRIALTHSDVSDVSSAYPFGCSLGIGRLGFAPFRTARLAGESDHTDYNYRFWTR